MDENQNVNQSSSLFRNPYYLSVLLLATYISVLCLFFRFSPETGDDTVLMSILTGAYGRPSAEIIFSNILYGKFLYGLFTAFPGINWYAWVQFLLTITAMYAASVMILKSFRPVKGGILLCLFYLSIGLDLFIYINFTKNAGLLCAVGYSMLIFHDNWKRIPERSINAITVFGLSIVFVWTGSLIRFDSFLAVSAVFSLYLLYLLAQEGLKKRIHLLATLVVALAVIVGGVFSMYFFNKQYYTNTSGWKEYIAFNSARSRVRDYPIPSYEENKERYEKIGVSYNDYLHLQTYNINDPNFYTTERLNLIADIREGKEKFEDSLASYQNSKDSDRASSSPVSSFVAPDSQEESDFLSDKKTNLANITGIYQFLKVFKDEKITSEETPSKQNGYLKMIIGYFRYSWLYLFITFLLLGNGKNKWIAGASAVVMLLVMSLYLYINGRYAQTRLQYLLWIAAIFVVISSFSDPEKTQQVGVLEENENFWDFKKLNWKKGALIGSTICGIIFGVATLNISLFAYSGALSKTVNTDVRNLYSYFASNKNSIFYIDTSTTYLGEYLDYFDYYDPADTENVIMLGGWYTGSVTSCDYLASIGQSSPMEHLADDNSFYVTRSDPSVQLTYIKEHYGVNASVEEVEAFGKYKVYRFVPQGD